MIRPSRIFDDGVGRVRWGVAVRVGVRHGRLALNTVGERDHVRVHHRTSDGSEGRRSVEPDRRSVDNRVTHLDLRDGNYLAMNKGCFRCTRDVGNLRFTPDLGRGEVSRDVRRDHFPPDAGGLETTDDRSRLGDDDIRSCGGGDRRGRDRSSR